MFRKILSIILGLSILALLYRHVRLGDIHQVFIGADWTFMSFGMVIFVPLILLTAWRLVQLVPAEHRIDLGEGSKLILAASTLNMILPSKMGDLAKAYFLTDKSNLPISFAFSLVVFERFCDLFAIFFCCTIGLLFYRCNHPFFQILSWLAISGLLVTALLILSKTPTLALLNFCSMLLPHNLSMKIARLASSWRELHTYLWCEPLLVPKIILVSIGLWGLHLFQIWLFILALNASVPFSVSISLTSFSILAGLLPLTFAGVGTRDAAILLLFKGFLSPPTAAALGLMCTLRYLLPAVAGIPFLGRYVVYFGRDKGQLL